MSIATNEAYKRYPSDAVLATARENNLCRRTAYIAGRTAEPTEAEIEAVARKIAETNWKVALKSEKTVSNGSPLYDWHFCINNAKSLLIAARKAVME